MNDDLKKMVICFEISIKSSLLGCLNLLRLWYWPPNGPICRGLALELHLYLSRTSTCTCLSISLFKSAQTLMLASKSKRDNLSRLSTCNRPSAYELNIATMDFSSGVLKDHRVAMFYRIIASQWNSMQSRLIFFSQSGFKVNADVSVKARLVCCWEVEYNLETWIKT